MGSPERRPDGESERLRRRDTKVEKEKRGGRGTGEGTRVRRTEEDRWTERQNGDRGGVGEG